MEFEKFCSKPYFPWQGIDPQKTEGYGTRGGVGGS